MQGRLHKTDWKNLTFAIYNLNLPERSEGKFGRLSSRKETFSLCSYDFGVENQVMLQYPINDSEDFVHAETAISKRRRTCN